MPTLRTAWFLGCVEFFQKQAFAAALHLLRKGEWLSCPPVASIGLEPLFASGRLGLQRAGGSLRVAAR